ncbi:MAG: hypothetical protein ACI9UQ_001754, partial [Candidatus Krumholzibacteriia bacterium]
MKKIQLNMKSFLIVFSIMIAAQVALALDAHLYEGFGNYERPITTDSEESQRYFNQGMQLMYGFNHDEAVRSFQQAALLDDKAAMPWWGIAYCRGININDPEMNEERSENAR